MFEVKVAEIMVTNVYSARGSDNVRSVLDKFAEFGIGGMPIVDKSNHLIGYISDGDIMRHLGKHMNRSLNYFTMAAEYYSGIGLNSSAGMEYDELKENLQQVIELNVLEVGVKRVMTVREQDDIVAVADLLSKRNIKKVPVERNKQLIGIVSRGDVVRAVVKSFLSISL